jgi:uncharacterized membrane protein YqiK
MRGPMDRARAGSVARWVAALGLGIPLAGCASTTRSVDAYYRQMAVNYQDAIKEARIREIAVEKQAKVLAATGDSRYHKYERELKSLRSWQEHCAREQQRFEKAAKWMESHFDVEKKEAGVASVTEMKPEPLPTDNGAVQVQGQDLKGALDN